MKNLLSYWQVWAFLSAIFAALTAIFAKVGIEKINSDFATFIRTIIILIVLGIILFSTNQFQSLKTISQKSLIFLVLSGIATGASWICYFRALKLGNASQVAPIDKLSVLLVAVLGAIFLGEKLSVIDWIGVSLIGTGAILIALRL
ncbi:MAG: EamA family transporter [Ignavibacterium album]|uniref:EamA family transporter n=1 Tax=Ignavibacterium album TaxID=591197 RepID=UPI0026F06D97|nr:EamA family transporter [Ignavibacterium album]MCX8106459.1 EamA family transporter [Ignavibacterium album]